MRSSGASSNVAAMLRPKSRARRTNENGTYGVNDLGSLNRCVRVRSLPVLSNSSTSHGLRVIRTRPNALVYVTALSVDVMRHDESLGTGPASISDGGPAMIAAGRLRVLMRSRSVRGLTKEISKGNAGSRSYSVAGNSVAVARENPRSSLLKLYDGETVYRSHWSVPMPVRASNAESRLAANKVWFGVRNSRATSMMSPSTWAEAACAPSTIDVAESAARASWRNVTGWPCSDMMFVVARRADVDDLRRALE